MANSRNAWSAWVRRVLRKKGSGVGKKDKQEIYEFLVYDTQVRKPHLIKETAGSADAGTVEAPAKGGGK